MNGSAKRNGSYPTVCNGSNNNKGGFDSYCNGSIIVLENYDYNNSLPKKPVQFEENGIMPKDKRPSPLYFQTKFGRCCSTFILAIFILVLLCLVTALIYLVFYLSVSSYRVNDVISDNTLINDNATQMAKTKQSNDNKESTRNKNVKDQKKLSPETHEEGEFIIKVSLYDPQQAKNVTKPIVDHSRLPLINLTQLCNEIKGDCWFHPKKYPHSCQKTYCESVEHEVSWNYSVNSMQFKPVSELYKLDSLPDRTPCGHKSWCINGQCVETDDARLPHYDSLPPSNGGWENNCEYPKCLVNGFSRKSDWTLLLMATKCPGMPCSAYTTEIRRLQFRSCTNPLPSQDGVGCNGKELPVLWGPVCQDCPSMLAGSEARKLWPNDVLQALCGADGRFLDNERCSCIRSNGQVERVDEGAPCRSKVNESRTEPGHCFYGVCLNYVNFKRHCNNY